MLHQGHLKELMSDQGRANFTRGREQHQRPPKLPSPAQTIQMIIGGGNDVSINSMKFTTTHKLKRSITHEQYDKLEESIIFDKSDTHCLVFPHYDALPITLRILDTYVKCIMVIDGSGACIIHPRVLTQMKLDNRIVPYYITLTGFNNVVVRTSGEVTLPVLAGGVTLEITFHIMDQDTVYNTIIGQPWIHVMKVVPSSLYQGKAKKAYQSTKSRSSEDEKDVIKDPEVVEAAGSTIEDLDPVQLDDKDHSKKAFIGHKLKELDKFRQFLKNNGDLFAFSHADMSGIPKQIATHKLNVDSFHPPVRQVRRKFNAAINDVVHEEVEKFLENGSIRESNYPQWVAYMVMVKKKNGKWCMCVDFTDPNKACLKHSFPLPHIDQLIDATTGHKLLSFLDAYSGYNQILIEE
uniref:Uncharacterized protein LOC104230977 n=1 Tax=Nicotiana sylvestris TaxID=4096 RepID=A0A1U7WQI7_NICSY|nr:PREDICTED: uncharacterized protein LOC104230977 [Nicotiana sylvestris]